MSLDPFAYNWEAPENCIVTKRFSQNAKMVKREKEPDNVQYFIVSDEKLETNLDSLYVSYTGGYNMKTGVPNKKFTQQFFCKPCVEPENSLSANGLKRVPSADQENSAANNGFQVGKHVGKDKLDYDLNLAVKVD